MSIVISSLQHLSCKVSGQTVYWLVCACGPCQTLRQTRRFTMYTLLGYPSHRTHLKEDNVRVAYHALSMRLPTRARHRSLRGRMYTARPVGKGNADSLAYVLSAVEDEDILQAPNIRNQLKEQDSPFCRDNNRGGGCVPCQAAETRMQCAWHRISQLRSTARVCVPSGQ
jgi:hypothetical protein